jgi:hypothetical protein
LPPPPPRRAASATSHQGAGICSLHAIQEAGQQACAGRCADQSGEHADGDRQPALPVRAGSSAARFARCRAGGATIITAAQG